MNTKQFQLPIFNPGKKVNYEGKMYTVDHIRIHKGDLFIKFVETTTEVNSEKIDCKPTVFVLK